MLAPLMVQEKVVPATVFGLVIVNTALDSEQMVEEATDTETVGRGFTITVAVCEEEHPFIDAVAV